MAKAVDIGPLFRQWVVDRAKEQAQAETLAQVARLKSDNNRLRSQLNRRIEADTACVVGGRPDRAVAPVKVLFLDFDGVLNHLGSPGAWGSSGVEALEAEHIEQLNRIVGETNAGVVISSTWRHAFPSLELVAMLNRAGFIGEVIGTTPLVRLGRGREILLWLTEFGAGRIDAWAILDDDDGPVAREPGVDGPAAGADGREGRRGDRGVGEARVADERPTPADVIANPSLVLEDRHEAAGYSFGGNLRRDELLAALAACGDGTCGHRYSRDGAQDRDACHRAADLLLLAYIGDPVLTEAWVGVEKWFS
jgi:hypothetical protein